MRIDAESWGRIGAAALAIALLLSAGAPRASAGVSVALQPASVSVSTGAEFDLDLVVTASGSAFNGFDAVIGYDPAAVTLVQLVPLSLQEGALMTAACGDRFHQFRSGTSSDTISEVLLCDGVSVTGPGQIYRLHFKASSTAHSTTVQFLPGLHFYNAGLYVVPVTSSNATVSIGTTAAVGDPPPARTALRILAAPNPARAGTSLRIEADRPGEYRILVMDVLGRVVRHLQAGPDAGVVRTVTWDGRSDDGRRLPAGVYRVQIRMSGSHAETRVVLLD